MKLIANNECQNAFDGRERMCGPRMKSTKDWLMIKIWEPAS